MVDKTALLDAGYTIQSKITRLKRGLPIAEAKQPSEFRKAKVRKEYNAKIKELQIQLKAINDVIGL